MITAAASYRLPAASQMKNTTFDTKKNRYVSTGGKVFLGKQ